MLLTSDHGGLARPSVYIDRDALRAQLQEALEAEGLPGRAEVNPPGLWIFDVEGADKAASVAAAAAVAAEHEAIAAALPWTAEGTLPEAAPHREAIELVYHPERIGDVYLLVEEGTAWDWYGGTGTDNTSITDNYAFMGPNSGGPGNASFREILTSDIAPVTGGSFDAGTY